MKKWSLCLLVFAILLTGCGREERIARADKAAAELREKIEEQKVEKAKYAHYNSEDLAYLEEMKPVVEDLHSNLNRFFELSKDLDTLYNNQDEVANLLENIESASVHIQYLNHVPDDARLKSSLHEWVAAAEELEFVATNYLPAVENMNEQMAQDCLTALKNAQQHLDIQRDIFPD